MSDQTGGPLQQCPTCAGWMLADAEAAHHCQPERDTPPDPWATVERFSCDLVVNPEAGSVWLNAPVYLVEEVDTARAEVEAQHARLRAERDTYRNGFESSQQQIGVLLDANAALRAQLEEVTQQATTLWRVASDHAEEVATLQQTLERCREVQQQTAEAWRVEHDQTLADCAPFLKDGESIAACIVRNRAEVDWFIEQNHKLSVMHAERVVERDRLQQILAAREQEIACLKGETTP